MTSRVFHKSIWQLIKIYASHKLGFSQVKKKTLIYCQNSWSIANTISSTLVHIKSFLENIFITCKMIYLSWYLVMQALVSLKYVASLIYFCGRVTRKNSFKQNTLVQVFPVFVLAPSTRCEDLQYKLHESIMSREALNSEVWTDVHTLTIPLMG